MKFRDLKIGTQLTLGIGIIIFMATLLGTIAVVHEESLWEVTSDLYEHPLKIRRAAGALEADFLRMDRGMENLFLTENEQEREQILQEISTEEADAFQQFDILYDRYLGPRSDIDTVYTDFVQWNTIRGETIRLLREGKTAEAASRITSIGVEDTQIEKDGERISGSSAISPELRPMNYSSPHSSRKMIYRAARGPARRHYPALLRCYLCPAESSAGPALRTDRCHRAVPAWRLQCPQPDCLRK